ncbi:MAG: sensor histidine kinase YesM [Psychroserpens sp.]|jgi:sensor histidine kinase YesM
MSYLKKITDSIQHKGVTRHFLFWIGIVLLTIPQNVLESEHPYINTFVYKMCVLIPHILASYFVAYFVIPKYLSKKKHAISLFLLIVGTYFFAVLARIFIIHIGENLVRKRPFEQETILEIVTQLRLLLLHYVPAIYSTVITFLAVKFFMNFKEIKEKELASKTEKVASELKALKAQLNPHFLFNTLNNIYVLSLDNSPKTPKSIEKLSKILDHVLYRCNTKYVSLSSEIELLENYIELEKLRYDDRLQINFNNHIEQDGEIAPLILLSLVENAFKHGAGEDSGSPKITIDLYNTNAQFKFVISNTVATKNDRIERTPIGLKNIKKQLDLIYPNKFELQIDNSPKEFMVTIKINNN